MIILATMGSTQNRSAAPSNMAPPKRATASKLPERMEFDPIIVLRAGDNPLILR
jgi:hypothetical protein